MVTWPASLFALTWWRAYELVKTIAITAFVIGIICLPVSFLTVNWTQPFCDLRSQIFQKRDKK
jgi:hypothetical protein